MKTRSPLSIVYSDLEGGWRSYIRYVKIAAKEGDRKMQKLIDTYNSLSKREQQKATPDWLCEMAGVNEEDLIAAVDPLIWRYAKATSSLVKAMFNANVLKQTAKQAMKAKNSRDRETFLKTTGELPTAKTNFNILNAGQLPPPPQPSPLRLPSVSEDLRLLESEEEVVDGEQNY